jgi:hypothetical protein
MFLGWATSQRTVHATSGDRDIERRLKTLGHGGIVPRQWSVPERHPPEDLKEMAEVHVAYELTRMALWARAATPDALVNQAILEAYLVHVRNVNEFLVRRSAKAYPDAVVAEDYFASEWSLDIELLTPAQLNDIHRRIAHLSNQRLARLTPGGQLDWAGNGLLDRWARLVIKGFGRFVADLRITDIERASWVKPGFDEAKRILGG